MESLGELLQQMKNPSFRRQSQAIEDELFSHPLIKELRTLYPELDDSKLRLNLSRLYQYVGDKRNCDNCPGLANCPNDFQGHFSKLGVQSVNGNAELYERKAPCSLHLTKQHDDQVKKRIRSFYVDERALNEGYKEVEIMGKDRLRAPAVQQVFRYIRETKENGLSTRGLYLYGSFGTGKTFLMSYMLHELAIAGLTGVIVYMPDFVEDLKSLMMDSVKLKESTEMMKNCDLLIFDDIGAENLNPWARDHIMGSILNYRMNRKPTFYTSNYTLEGLEKHLSFTNKDGEEGNKGQRLMDRISPFVDVVNLHGENQRGKH
ncbi:AFG1/ZapE family ATPase [Paenibacillus macquariensis]|uniref:Replicative DNA helicase loader DnaI n=1 Tax=Paenibacillus macquariensis TaxID=948756 RepID=A0ABY1JT02_9BACL|nr:AFG1/ZapE family ATPase [Paenibacillus macquariensis]MEC0093028.1 ATP-binding protein [Paenibacillus macquariensis]OAB36383.1 AAA family ATPase [Paenibacillus macquariensis subsp. macquariensis]SIQ71005.1 replicative DNA helicase loader DnaI [Paenibacillus macquariensis]